MSVNNNRPSVQIPCRQCEEELIGDKTLSCTINVQNSPRREKRNGLFRASNDDIFKLRGRHRELRERLKRNYCVGIKLLRVMRNREKGRN
ncbi:hypothetical protein NPIL_79961 [Nephila pilipes]|uniref:Uncharacterized protein n=1 Tax=Nephila pilipes TaxID=299642 RepID=A0A8X6UC82_NEPPI|nr:hypothetical protein NPIL_79961 [Nephila pilipes]